LPRLTRECGGAPLLAVESNQWVPCGAGRIKPGFYAPVTRPTGATEPFAGQLELQMARLRFPPPGPQQVLPGQQTYMHLFNVETPQGTLLQCPVYMGLYTPCVMAQNLTRSVRLKETAVGVECFQTFLARFDVVRSRFVFSDTLGRPFRLRFDLPGGYPPERWGFEGRMYEGDACYAGAEVHIPRRHARGGEGEGGACLGYPVNWYQVSERPDRRFDVAGQAVRTVQAAPWSVDPPAPLPPDECCPVAAAAPPCDENLHALRTFVTGCNADGKECPFGLPFQRYDVVILTAIQDNLCARFLAVVTEDAGLWHPFKTDMVATLKVFCPGLPKLAVGDSAQISVSPCANYAPLSWANPVASQACGEMHALPARYLGFDLGATLWRPCANNTLRAPRAFSLDHPDYVVMDLETPNGPGQDTFITRGKSCANLFFAKLTMYPAFQVHSMCPKELVSSSMHSPVAFRVRFLNPDGSAYCLNGREFSFSMQYISPVGTM
jgi:hypothetical protein